MSQATSIDANLNFDLKNSDLASVQAFPNPGETSDNWTTQFLSFSKVQPVAGDTLDINLNFVDALTGDQQRLQITNHGPNEFVRVFDRLDGSSTLSVQALTTNSVTFQDVRGSLLVNPFVFTSQSSGNGIAGDSFPTNLTNGTFSFTGITWQYDFSQLTYFSDNGFSLTAFALAADDIRVIPPRSRAQYSGSVRLGVNGTWNGRNYSQAKEHDEHTGAKPR